MRLSWTWQINLVLTPQVWRTRYNIKEPRTALNPEMGGNSTSPIALRQLTEHQAITARTF
jgi:hypothetical protein